MLLAGSAPSPRAWTARLPGLLGWLSADAWATGAATAAGGVASVTGRVHEVTWLTRSA